MYFLAEDAYVPASLKVLLTLTVSLLFLALVVTLAGFDLEFLPRVATCASLEAVMTLLLVSTHHFNSQITWELKSTTNSLAFVLDNGILYLYRDKIRYGVTETATIVATITIDGQSVTKQFTISLV